MYFVSPRLNIDRASKLFLNRRACLVMSHQSPCGSRFDLRDARPDRWAAYTMVVRLALGVRSINGQDLQLKHTYVSNMTFL